MRDVGFLVLVLVGCIFAFDRGHRDGYQRAKAECTNRVVGDSVLSHEAWSSSDIMAHPDVLTARALDAGSVP